MSDLSKDLPCTAVYENPYALGMVQGYLSVEFCALKQMRTFSGPFQESFQNHPVQATS